MSAVTAGGAGDAPGVGESLRRTTRTNDYLPSAAGYEECFIDLGGARGLRQPSPTAVLRASTLTILDERRSGNYHADSERRVCSVYGDEGAR